VLVVKVITMEMEMVIIDGEEINQELLVED
jgi:hypothetical protein